MDEAPFSTDDPRPRLTWAEASRRLAEADSYWLATVCPDGAPHVMPVLAVWSDGALHVVAGKASRKAENLARNAHRVITTGAEGLDSVLEGEAGKVGDGAKLRRVADVYASKYDWHVTIRDGALYADSAPTAGPPPYDVYEVKPTSAFGFGADESFGATRWRF